MKQRGYKVNPKWLDFYYRGERTKPLEGNTVLRTGREMRYREHDYPYLVKCAEQLKKDIEHKQELTTPIERIRFMEWYRENMI
jgi:uncharacterized protein (TIGR02328 family)